MLLALLVACTPDPADSKAPTPDDTAETAGPDTADSVDSADSEDSAPVDADGDGWPAGEDCDDADPTVHPDAVETCDNRDEDCDDAVDEDAADATSWYRDDDADGYGVETDTVRSCDPVAGYADEGGDCDDTDYSVSPRMQESCDRVDEDCDGEVDEDADDAPTWYDDGDGDGFGDPGSAIRACDAPAGTTEDASDCDDTDADVSPDGLEVCDGVDNNCDGRTDGGDALDATTWYADADGDGYGDDRTGTHACDPGSGWTADSADCDDSSADAHPGGTEVCDHLDNDCDGTTDEADATDATWLYADADGDGYGDAAVPMLACFEGDGISATSDDCDDTLASVHPGTTEACDGTDSDCDGRDVPSLLVPDDAATIQDAVDLATAGDSVCVSAGTWSGPIVMEVDGVSLVGAAGSTTTVIDGGGPVVTLTGDDLRVEGFTITGGDAEEGAGVLVTGDRATLQELWITANTCADIRCLGTGLYVNEASDTWIEDVRISDGTQQPGYRGAGVYVTGSYANPTSLDVEVDGNVQLADGLDGGGQGTGMMVLNADVTLDGVSVHDNRMEIAGEGVDGNSAGIFLEGGDMTLADVTVEDNRIETVDTDAWGPGWRAAGVDIVAGDVVWVGGVIAGNSLEVDADRPQVVYGGGMNIEAGATLTMSQVLVADNTIVCASCLAYGGGIAVSGVPAYLENVIVAGNSVTDTVDGAAGGGIAVTIRGEAWLTNCDVVGNVVTGVTSADGGGLYTESPATVVLADTNVVANVLDAPTPRGGAVYLASSSVSFGATWCDFYGNTATEFENLSSPVGAYGNVAVDPLYVDTTASSARDWDLHLGTGSPCVDAGDPSCADADGSVCDLGGFGGPEGAW